MPLSLDLQRRLSRFRRLPQTNDVWEGAIAALPMWVDGGPEGEPYRPQAALWASTTRQLAHVTDLKGPGDPVGIEDALSALFEMGTSAKLANARPRALRVRDAQLADALREALEGEDILIEVADELPALRDFLSQTAVAMSEDRVPGALTGPGVTVDRLHAFADAARQFFDAAPWRHLNDGDLIAIEKPKTGGGLDLVGVMGSAGEEFGVGFFASAKQYRDIIAGAEVGEIIEHGGEWAIYFSPGWEVPAVDLDTWERFNLPLGGPRAYPLCMRLDRKRQPQRPDAGRLAHFEGLLRALAATTEAEMDTGRWSHTVSTAEGERTYTLTLPDLLEPQATPPVSDTPLERAQGLIDRAFETRGRRQLHLIREALALSPDCADAYLLLSERSSSPDEIRSLLDKAIAAGERALGPGAVADPVRSLWEDVNTRPYMRARAALAEVLFAGRDYRAAVDHYRALLQLDPGDNQGLRYRLLSTLLEANMNEDAETLLLQYDETDAQWQYASVLLALRAGDRKLARKRLRAALKSNRRVPAYLTGRRELPDAGPDYFAYGSDDEAVIYAMDAIDQWEATPGAVAWLRVETR